MLNSELEQTLPCQDKAKYSDKKQAQAAAVLAKHRHGARFKPYHCPHCGLWHLASDYS
jgi:hypothetical protein